MLVKVALAAGLALAPWAASARSVTTLYSFTGGADGLIPVSGVIDVSGTLYGTTAGGGATGLGTVFAIDPATGAETVLYSFKGAPDGEYPAGALIERDGTLYGTTRQGGVTKGHARQRGRGVVFSVDIDTGAEQALSFGGPEPPKEPLDGVVYLGGKLYGTSQQGGALNNGTLFAVRAHSERYVRLIYSFSAPNGRRTPIGGLLEQGGLLYGTEPHAGAHTRGEVFSFDTTTNTETVLYSFGDQPGDGSGPATALIYHDGILYGTTLRGGASDRGTVFSLDPTSGTETVLYSFAGGNDGSTPSNSLLYRNGNLYGTTAVGGGDSNQGTVFKVDAVTGAERVLARFGVNGNGGANPDGPLIFANGSFYGTTARGGAKNAGTVFQLQE
jgi:uncharacterized repeat protein (TIGR03803 family)